MKNTGAYSCFFIYCILTSIGFCVTDTSPLSFEPQINVAKDTMNVACKYQKIHQSKSEVLGICTYLGETCSVEVYRNGSATRKQINCECLRPIGPSVVQMFNKDQDADYSLPMEIQVNNTVIGKKLKGNLLNGASLKTGYHGNGLYLDGVDDYLDLSVNGESCLGNISLCENGLTFSMWLLPDNFTTTRQWYFGNIADNNFGFRLFQINSKLKIKLTTIMKKWVSYSFVLVKKWTMVTVTWNPQGNMRVFIDGCLHEDVSARPGSQRCRKRKTIIGKALNQKDQYASGTVDEVTFWERCLKAEEVMSLFLKYF